MAGRVGLQRSGRVDAEPVLQARALFERLNAGGVEFVVIGGVAGILLGSDLMTSDVDIVPRRAEENLDRLSRVLVELHAEVRFAGPVGRMKTGEWLLGGATWNLDTDLGRLDLLFTPAGGGDYEALAARAVRIDTVPSVLVASLDDLIAMKEAANRTKDQLALPILRWLKARGGDVADEYPDPP